MGINITKRMVFKIIELVLTCILLILLFRTTWSYSQDHDFLQSGTYFGYLIIVVGLLLGEIMGTPVDKLIDMYFSIVGCAFFIGIGAVYVQSPYNYLEKNTTKGAFSIVNGIVFFIDAALNFLNK